VRKDDFLELDRNTVSADSIRPNLMNDIADFQLKSVDECKFFCLVLLGLTVCGGCETCVQLIWDVKNDAIHRLSHSNTQRKKLLVQ
jgi:hypothetical protein